MAKLELPDLMSNQQPLGIFAVIKNYFLFLRLFIILRMLDFQSEKKTVQESSYWRCTTIILKIKKVFITNVLVLMEGFLV